MRIAVIGTGTIGSVLAQHFTAAGHRVTFGARDDAAASPVTGVELRSVEEAVRGAEVVVLAVPGPAVAEVVSVLGSALDGVLVLDAANRIGSAKANNADTVAAVPGARYARVFNSVGAETLREPVVDGAPVDMLYACAAEERATVESLIEATGCRPVWAGAEGADVCDAALRVWLGLARTFGRHFGLRVVSAGPQAG